VTLSAARLAAPRSDIHMPSVEPRSSVSIVIPCFNQARYLAAAIQSALTQPITEIECLVVDDGSTDHTALVARSAGATLLTQGNAGVSSARNTGLDAARGELVVFLDADDELVPGAVALMAAELEQAADAAAAVGRCQPIDNEGRALPAHYDPIDPARLYQEWLPKNFVWTPGAAIFRRDALREIGGFPPRLGPGADYAVYLRLARTGHVRFVDVPVVRYRQHESSMSTDPALMLRTTLAVLRRERRQTDAMLVPDVEHGMQQWREFYGTQIVECLRRDVKRGRFGIRQARMLGTLLARCPRVATRHAIQKMRLALGFRGPDSQATVPDRYPDPVKRD
jgi:GT2 family glycosyltransferase